MRPSQKVSRHKQSFDQYYLWHPLVKHIWLKGRIPDVEREVVRMHFAGNLGPFEAEFSEHVYDLLGLEPGLRILNIGCGFGRDEQSMSHRCPDLELVGCDVSETMLRTARRNRIPGRLTMCVAERLPFPDASFHRVLSREVIEHVIVPQTVLNEVRRVLVPGGRAVITTPNGSSLVLRAVTLTGWFENREVQDTAIPLSNLRALFRDSGLEIQRIILDGAGYFMMVAWPRPFSYLVPVAARLTRVFRHLPLIRSLVCDQVKYLAVKPGDPASAKAEVHPTHIPETYPESPLDKDLRRIIEATEEPRRSWKSAAARSICSILLLSPVYVLIVLCLLPVSLVLLVLEHLAAWRGNGGVYVRHRREGPLE